MLVLTRKQNQDIVIGDNIRVSVLKVKGNTVRIGIEAPRHVRVVRGELPPNEEVADVPSMAEVTLVFNEESAEIKTEKDLSTPGGSASKNRLQSKLTTGSSTKDTKSRFANSSQDSKGDSGSAPTIRFTDRLPETLQHNRLKQIVNEITRTANQNGR